MCIRDRINAVNDAPIRTAGDVETLYLLEDEAIASMGLAGVTYSAGGGADENAQTARLVIKATSLPSAGFGTVFHADGTTAVTLNEVLDLAELQGLKFEPGTNATGSENFVFTVTDDGTTNGVADPLTLTETLAINITPFNDTPVLPTDAIVFETDGVERTATEDTTFDFVLADLLNGVTDPDINDDGTNPYGDVLTVDPTSVTATNGSIAYDLSLIHI